jgi:hypothetical protein
VLGLRPRAWLAALAALGLVLGLTAVGAQSASAAGETLAVVLDQTDGTAPFDALDANDANGIVRVNDSVTYKVEFSVNNAAATNATFTMTLPSGLILNALPAYCTGPGSSLTPAGPSLAPPVPLTATYYTTMPTQVLVCNVGARTANSTETYNVTPTMSSAVPNGTTLPAVTVSVSTDGAGPVVSNPKTVTAASELRWDLSKNSISATPDSGQVFGPGPTTCPWDPTLGCIIIGYPISLSAPAQGKGAEPVGNQPITFTDDLSPAALFSQLSPAQIAAMNADPAKYGVRLDTTSSCSQAAAYDNPGNKIGNGGGTYTATNSVRDSGTVTCTQASPGAPVSVTITNPDTSLFTFPTNTKTDTGGTGIALPTNAAYAVSTQMTIYIPAATINDFGIESNGVTTLVTKNTYTNLHIVGLNPNDVQTGDTNPTNDYRTLTPNVRIAGSFNKYFVGDPGYPTNTPSTVFDSGNSVHQGPPGGGTILSGTINAAPGQTVVSQLAIVGSDATNSQNMTALACDAWDNTKLQLQAKDYAGLAAAGPTQDLSSWSQYVGSGGKAVWLSGYNNTGLASPFAASVDASTLPAYTVEYGTGPAGDTTKSICGNADSPAGWFTDPSQVPGNDPTLAAQGVYTAVTRVRVWVQLPAPSTVNPPYSSSAVIAYAGIGLRVAGNVTAGQILPNWASVMFHNNGYEDEQTMLADNSIGWNWSTYNPGTAIGNGHTGGPGDRLIAAPAYPRITKLVKGPNDADFGSTTPAVTGGQTVQYKLSPSLSSAGLAQSIGQDVWVEDCLPSSQIFTSATVTPTLITVGSTPADTKMSAPCPAGATYIRWDLGPLLPNQPIAPIVVDVQVSNVAPDGTYENDVIISAANDLSPQSLRKADAEIQIQSPAGIHLEKQALTPLTQVNRVGQTTNELNKWKVSLASVNGPPGITNPDIIDVLPAQGDAAGTHFTGTFQFVSATPVDGGSGTAGVTLAYTKAPAVNQDPSDASNGAAGSTVWCSGTTTGATVVSGAGTSADCPASPSAVTGVRIQRPGAFATGDVIAAEIDMVGVGNSAGDVYDNTSFARATGLALAVGPVVRPETVEGSSIGDFVWIDSNSNGAQDSGEPGVVGFPVSLSGTDDLGNAVTATATTGAGGIYGFPNLRAGTYTVTFAPAGLTGQQTFTTQNAAGVSGALNSDGDATTGVAAPVTLPANTIDLDIDQGIIDNTPPPLTPTLSTQISTQNAYIGATLSDTVTVGNTGGATIVGTWSLLGPVAPGADGTCATAIWTGAATFQSGTFSAVGDGDVVTGPSNAITAAGCYTFVDSLAATSTTAAVPQTIAGLAPETALISNLLVPTISTQVSAQTAFVGSTLTDAVTIAGTGGAAVTGAWSLLGPVAPVGSSCVGVDWTGAATFQSGTFSSTGDATVTTGPTNALTVAGCYTFVDSLNATATTAAVPQTAAGLATETALITSLLVPTIATAASTQSALVGATLSDSVVIAGTGGATVSGTWSLLGPVAPGADGTCATADWTGAATFQTGALSSTGDATVTTGPTNALTVAGCYTFVDSLNATASTAAVSTLPGLVSETALVKNQPALSTQVSAAVAYVGAQLSDTVTVTGTGGTTIQGTWSLLGPVAPGADATCATADWTGAATVQTGTFTAPGDGDVVTGPTNPLSVAGCYTFVDSLAATPMTAAVAQTAAGLATETALITELLVPTIATTVSTQTAAVGATLSDSVVIAGTGGATVTGTWSLLGPVAPGADGTCASADWTGAAIFQTGQFTSEGDGTITTGPSDPLTDAGCYTFVDTLSATSSTAAIPQTQAGLASETALVADYAVGDYVWFDANGNGLQDSSESGVSGVGVTLEDSTGTVLDSTTTDSTGYYHFDKLPAGDYIVVFTAPAGQMFATQTVGDDRTVDSNPNASGITATFTLGPPADGNNVAPSVESDAVTALFIDRTIDAGLIDVPPTPTPSTTAPTTTAPSTPSPSTTPPTSLSTTPSGSGALPFTGSRVEQTLWLGGLILGVGLLLMLASARRRQARGAQHR